MLKKEVKPVKLRGMSHLKKLTCFLIRIDARTAVVTSVHVKQFFTKWKIQLLPDLPLSYFASYVWNEICCKDWPGWDPKPPVKLSAIFSVAMGMVRASNATFHREIL